MKFYRTPQNQFSNLFQSRAHSSQRASQGRSRLLMLAIAVLAVFFGALPAIAQTVSATMVGTVNDKSGAVVSNAKVTVVELTTNLTHTVTSNDSGNYSIPDLPPGSYSLTVEAQGFRRETRPSIDLVVNTTTRIDFDLLPGAVNDTVTVTTAPALLQTDRADVSTKLEAEKVADLPLGVNRNFQSLLNLVPGTTPASFQHSQFFNAQSSLQTEANGTPRMGNSYQIEGIDDDERTGLLQIMIPPADSIETVDISTNNFEAELGRAVGAVTNVTLKSGTNKFHGSASEYLQNNDFNAISYYNKSTGHLAYNYFGGNISGPIFKDKLFFYGDYFRISDHEANANTMTIPFQKYYTPNANGFIDLSDLLVGGKGQIYDPATGDSLGRNRTPFAGNLIPANRVNSVATALFKLLPAANQNTTALSAPSNNYFATLPFQKGSDTYDAKLDYQLNEKNRLSYRFGYQKSNVFQAPVFGAAGGGPANGAFAGVGTQNAYSTAVNYNRTFSSTLLSEFRFGVAHYRSSANPTDYGSNDATNIGIPGVNISPFTSGQVGISLGSFSSPMIGYSASVPWVRGETNIDLANHWTKIIGNHTIKFGADIRRIRDELLQDQTFSPRGVITFGENQTSTCLIQANGSCTAQATNAANDMASMLLDLPSGVGRDVNTYTPDLRAWWLFFFAGDKWQATSKLTLDLGVRWELYPPMTPAHPGGFSNYDPVGNNLVIAGVGGNAMGLGQSTKYKYVAPRLGFAYRATEQTVIRGGFGISYTPFEDNTYAYNYPVRSNNQYSTCGTGTATTYGAAVYTCTNNVPGSVVTFQAGFPAPVAVTIPSNGIIPVTGNALLTSQSYTIIPTNYTNPSVDSWNVAVQQALPGDFSLNIAYVANHGVHFGTSQNINLPDRLNCGTACYPGILAGFSRTAGNTVQFYGNSSNYQSLQVTLDHRMRHGFSTNTAFTWGKGLGYQTGDDGGLYFFQQPRRNYAPNDFDRRTNIEESFTYQLPFGKGQRYLHDGVLATAFGGWKISGIVSLVSGLPFNITASGSSINTSGMTQTANINGGFKVTHQIGNGRTWFDPTSFSQPIGCTNYAVATPTTNTCPVIAGTTVGNIGRNNYYGPGYVQDNASIFKTFPLVENFTLDVRLDAVQLSNTPQFGNPSSSITSTTFGQITSTIGSGTGANGIGGGRYLQLAAILKF